MEGIIRDELQFHHLCNKPQGRRNPAGWRKTVDSADKRCERHNHLDLGLNKQRVTEGGREKKQQQEGTMRRMWRRMRRRGRREGEQRKEWTRGGGKGRWRKSVEQQENWLLLLHSGRPLGTLRTFACFFFSFEWLMIDTVSAKEGCVETWATGLSTAEMTSGPCFKTVGVWKWAWPEARLWDQCLLKNRLPHLWKNR